MDYYGGDSADFYGGYAEPLMKAEDAVKKAIEKVRKLRGKCTEFSSSGKSGKKRCKKYGGTLYGDNTSYNLGGAVAHNPWLAHMARVRAQHPGLPQSEVAKLASRTY
jgi:hypothetical protein